MTNTRTRNTALVVSMLLLGAFLGWWLSPGRAYSEPANVHPVRDIPVWVVRPCEARYDVNCRHGHAEHVSVVRQVPGRVGMVCVFYAEPNYARTHDYCS